MSDVKIPIGDMKTRVLLQNSAIMSDSGGAQSPAWTDLATVWCKWVNAHGPEVVTSEAMKAVRRATVTIRYLTGVTEKTSLVKDGERWQVVSLDDIQNNHEYIELIVESAKGTV